MVKKDVSDGLALQKMFVDHFVGTVPESCKKKIVYVMQGNGLWQIRKTPLGTFFLHQAKINIPGLPSTYLEGWQLDIPLIPLSMLKTALSFFRAVYEKHGTESHVQIFYNKEANEYVLNCPKQQVSAASVKYENDTSFDPLTYILVLEMHSHGSMQAFFSNTDDGDEKEDRFFGVVGRVAQYYPEIKLRASVGGTMIDADINDIFETDDVSFPKEWMKKVKKFEPKVKQFMFPKHFGQLPMFEKEMEEDFTAQEMKKYLSGDFNYPAEFFVPDDGVEVEENKYLDLHDWKNRRF